MGMLYLLSPDGSQSEHDEAQVKVQWQEGHLKGDFFCWKEGMQEWTPLPFYFGSSPLPIPGAPPRERVARRRYQLRKDPRLLTGFLLVLLGLNLLFEGVVLFRHYQEYVGYSGANTSNAQSEALMSQQEKLGLAYLLLFILTFITFLMWLYRTSYNSYCFGTRDMKISPAWSVGWFFVPFMNLFKPYQAMSEIWKVSLDPKRWQAQSASPLVILWWIFWLLSNTLGQAAGRFRLVVPETGSDRFAALLSMAASGASIILYLLMVCMVYQINKQQRKLTANSSGIE